MCVAECVAGSNDVSIMLQAVSNYERERERESYELLRLAT